MPPNYSLAMLHGVLHLMPRPDEHGKHLPIDDLRPALLDTLGLDESLRELVAQCNQHHPEMAYDLALDGELGNLSESLNITLYRIVQEAPTNIATMPKPAMLMCGCAAYRV